MGSERTLNIFRSICRACCFHYCHHVEPQNAWNTQGPGTESFPGDSSGHFLATELESDREESLEEKSVKVRTSSDTHKVRDHNSTKQICLCVYLYTATQADLALWWKTGVACQPEMSKWQSCSERNSKRGIDMQMAIYTLLVTPMSSCTQSTRMHTKAELSTFIAGRARSEPAPTSSFQSGGNAALNIRSTRGWGTLEVKWNRTYVCVWVWVCVEVQTGENEKMWEPSQSYSLFASD